MQNLYLISGPCGCGKTTLSNAFARHLVNQRGKQQVYVIHGDDFQTGFVETKEPVGPSCPGFLYWPDIRQFNWQCLLSVAGMALERGLDIVIDYVVEDEYSLMEALARRYNVRLHYAVLTASESEITKRLAKRGDPWLTERSHFLKHKLDNLPENQGHLIDTNGKSTEEIIAAFEQLIAAQ